MLPEKVEGYRLINEPRMPHAHSRIFKHETIENLWFIAVEKIHGGRVVESFAYYQDMITGLYYETEADCLKAMKERS